jgi:hypothetical protein
MMMWRPIEPFEDDVSDLPAIDPQKKHRRSHRRAWHDGLAAQTVIENLENVRSYRSFERAIIASLCPRSVIELELVYRLASLFWRLRRASAIETGLFEIQGELLLARRRDPSCGPNQPVILQTSTRANGHQKVAGSNGRHNPQASDPEPVSTSIRSRHGQLSNPRAIAQCFLRLSNLDSSLLDRAGSYESRLWRQAAQAIWTLEAMRRPPPAPTRRPFRKPVVRRYWDAEK